MKKFLTLFIINAFVFNQVSLSQLSQSKDSIILHLLSLEDKEVSVKIDFDGRNDELVLELNTNEKICIFEARYLSQDIKILSQRFIELQIGVRGGSGVSVHRYVLICISGDKLYKSVDVISLVKNLVDGSIDCQVDFTGLTEKNKSFELIANGEKAFHFDSENKIFCNGLENLNGLYYVNSDKDLSSKQLNFNNEKFPSICVNQTAIYIFIKHKWYVESHENHLMELTSCCN